MEYFVYLGGTQIKGTRCFIDLGAPEIRFLALKYQGPIDGWQLTLPGNIVNRLKSVAIEGDTVILTNAQGQDLKTDVSKFEAMILDMKKVNGFLFTYSQESFSIEAPRRDENENCNQ